VAGLVIYQSDNTPGLYAYDGSAWVLLNPDNLGNHTATQTLNLNAQRLSGVATSPLGDSVAQVQFQATVPSKSVALITRSYYGRNYTRTMLSGYGTGPSGQDIDYAVWGNAYRSDGWAGIFTAGKPGSPLRWVGLAGHPGYVNANAAIRIVDGTQAAGRVLTSDGVGNGKWLPITAAGGNFNLGTYQLVGNGGANGIRISSSGVVEQAGVESPTLLLHSNGNDDVTGGTLQWREDNTAYGWNLRHNTGGAEAGQAADRLILERLNGAGAVSVMSWNQANGNVGINTLNAGSPWTWPAPSAAITCRPPTGASSRTCGRWPGRWPPCSASCVGCATTGTRWACSTAARPAPCCWACWPRKSSRCTLSW